MNFKQYKKARSLVAGFLFISEGVSYFMQLR